MSLVGLRWGPRLALLSIALFTGDCGYIGPPLPPALKLPNRVTDLTAAQRGSNIVIQFTMPKLTTEALPITDPPEIDLRVGASTHVFNESEWLQHARRIPTTEGHTEYSVAIDEFQGKDIVVAVRLLNDRGRTAGWSNFVPLLVTAPLGRPEHLSAEATAQGVALSWTGGASPSYRVYRKEAIGEFQPLGDATGNSYMDTTAEYGKPYSYFVQGVGKTGAAESVSEASDTVTITPVDTFPPAVPANLKAIAGTKTVELSWDRDTESDLAGYRVFRAVGDGPFELLADKLPGASYSDHAVKTGKYRYSVSAYDLLGNESARSPAIDIVAP